MNSRNRISILLLLGVFIGLCAASNSHANRIRYHFVDLGTLSGHHTSYGTGINNWGHIVGVSETIDQGESRAFLWKRMKMINLGSLHDDPYSGAWSINDRGQVVGFSFDGDEKFQAVLWDRHGMHPLDTLGGSFTYANAVNRYGEIAGQATFPDESYYESGHAVLWNKQGITDITPFDSDWSTASSINKDGVAVGAYFNADGLWHAVLWDENGVYPMETLGGDQSVAYWINDKGEAVGGCVLPESHRWHACLWDVNGFPWDLSTPEGPDSEAYCINDRGQVVGLYYPDGGPRAFLWSRNHGMLDLTALADLPDGVVLTTAFSINDFGWITGTSSLGTAYLLIPYWPFTR